MARPFTWQWLWKSRARLVTCGALVLVAGIGLLVRNELRENRHHHGRRLVTGAMIAGFGGWFVIQGLLSGRDSFGDRRDDYK